MKKIEDYKSISYRKNSLDLKDEKTIDFLVSLEKKLADVFIKELDKSNPMKNEKIITAILAKIISGSPCLNEQLQGIVDAVVTYYSTESIPFKIIILLENEDDKELWKIEGKNLNRKEN